MSEGAGQRSADERRTAVGDFDCDALLCALILAPHVFSRNRYYWLFEAPERRRVRRRASRVRGIARQLLGDGRARAEVVGEQVLDDGQVLLRYKAPELGYSRTAALSRLEAASLRFVLHRARGDALSDADRQLVESSLDRLGNSLGVAGSEFSHPAEGEPPHRPSEPLSSERPGQDESAS